MLDNCSQEATWLFKTPQGIRAVLKSGNLARDEADDQVKAAAHLLFEGWTSAIARPALAACPTPILSLYGSAHDAQHGRGHRVAHPAAVFCGAHVQAVMQAVFNAPILAGGGGGGGGGGPPGGPTGGRHKEPHHPFSSPLLVCG